MKITIIGWYGTETVGDRAILAGLLSFFNKSFNKFSINLGSLYPFFSERTLNEDYSFYKELVKKDFDIRIFNSKNSNELSIAIKNSDLVLMGGGPLMDLPELFMIEYAFKKAKKLGVSTALIGCGIGPLSKKKYRKSVLNIFLKSDLVILRDNRSKKSLLEICREFNMSNKNKSISVGYDPSVEAILYFKKANKKIEKHYIAINLREFPHEYKYGEYQKLNEDLKLYIKQVATYHSNREVKLIPMHYFHIGGDDRMFLNKIALELNFENIIVQNTNINLKETMELFQNSYCNIGMRFHSIVFQTILSGKNFILDYTDPIKGKIVGFLSDIDKNNFYSKKYINLQSDKLLSPGLIDDKEVFNFDEHIEIEKLNVYTKKLKELSN